MTSPTPAHLRLHIEELPEVQPPLALAPLAPFLKAFEQATGWQLRYEQSPVAVGEHWSAPIDGGHGAPTGRLVLGLPPAGETGPVAPALDLHLVRPLALATAGLLSEIYRLRRAVHEREAELAAGVPVASRPEEPHLADRLESVLKAGAEAIGCQAAGLYLLDEGTSELKLRAAWGLDRQRLLAPARPLRGAVADLEALVGHAVVLEDTSLLPHWRCPEDFPAAVCVPVSSPTVPLGTLWLFSTQCREFNEAQTNLVEIIAGRIAADLEREMLLAVGKQAKLHDRQFDVASQWQFDRLPSFAPLLDDYEVSGWTQQASGVGGDFHDWAVLPDGRLALAVGDADGRPLEAALGMAALLAAVKAHANYGHAPHELLARVNELLLNSSPGDQRASLAYALTDPHSHRLELALAGEVGAILVPAKGRRILASETPPLGQSSDSTFRRYHTTLKAGEVLLLISGGVRRAVDAAGMRIGEPALARLLSQHHAESADGLVARLRRLLDRGDANSDDLTVLVLKRRR